MKKIALATAVAAVLSASAAFADTYTVGPVTFGTFGSTTDIPTDINQTLTVDGWSSAAVQSVVGAGATLTNVIVEIRGSISTEGNGTNTAANTAADVHAVVAAFFGNWQATTSDLTGADHVFASNGSNIIDIPLGAVAPNESVSWGPSTNDSGWTTVFTGAGAAVEALTSISYFFETHTISTITGSSNFNSSFTTASAGGLRVTYEYQPAPPPPPQVPTPAPLAMMGLGLLGLAARRRIKRG